MQMSPEPMIRPSWHMLSRHVWVQCGQKSFCSTPALATLWVFLAPVVQNLKETSNNRALNQQSTNWVSEYPWVGCKNVYIFFFSGSRVLSFYHILEGPMTRRELRCFLEKQKPKHLPCHLCRATHSNSPQIDPIWRLFRQPHFLCHWKYFL